MNKPIHSWSASLTLALGMSGIVPDAAWACTAANWPPPDGNYTAGVIALAVVATSASLWSRLVWETSRSIDQPPKRKKLAFASGFISAGAIYACLWSLTLLWETVSFLSIVDPCARFG